MKIFISPESEVRLLCTYETNSVDWERPPGHNGSSYSVLIATIEKWHYNSLLKGGKRPLPFSQASWGSGGRRFKSSRPDFELEM